MEPPSVVFPFCFALLLLCPIGLMFMFHLFGRLSLLFSKPCALFHMKGLENKNVPERHVIATHENIHCFLYLSNYLTLHLSVIIPLKAILQAWSLCVVSHLSH